MKTTSRPKPSPGPVRRRVFLVDDHPMMRAGLAAWIRSQPDLEVVGEASDAPSALGAVPAARPDLLVTDLTLPGRSGLELIKDLLAQLPGLPILVLSMHDELVHAERALRAGARGYLMKEAGGERLLAAIREVLSGRVSVSPRMASVLLDSLSGPGPRGGGSPIGRLSDREFEVFQRIGQGLTPRDIAREMGISVKTVDVHRANLKAKLSLPHMSDLVRHAVQWVGGASGS
ncbi:MAG: response regulator transcription factor [Verrucomicrobium sp.]|jgi:DNA-binding NarL/FixJ family response regulator|nr:response regulator transcription factor [Verrucomicrobium sp.]